MKFTLACSLLAVAAYTSAKIERPPHQPTSNGTRLLTFADAESGLLSASRRRFNWVRDSKREGAYITASEDGALVFEDIVTQNRSVFIPAEQRPNGTVREFWLNTDASKVLWATDSIKQYRYSYFANYFVQDVATGSLEPLDPEQDADIQYAVFSPSLTSTTVAFVKGNNLHIWQDGQITQITNDGGPDLFNGVPDWVYEEEILGSNYALWFNDDGRQLVYLSTNETGVPTFTVQYYMNVTDPESSVAPSYPRDLDIRYPKVGATNPTISATLLDLSAGAAATKKTVLPLEGTDPLDFIIGEVAWLGSQVAMRAFNRVQDKSALHLYDTATGSTKIIGRQDGTDGWLDNSMSIQFIGKLNNNTSAEYYLETSDLSGFNHIYLKSTTGESKALTTGEFEVRSILHVDVAGGIVYYTSTEAHPTESHIFSVNMQTLERVALTDPSTPGFWTASFTPGGTHYVLNYEGPNVPFQELYATQDLGTPVRVITTNDALVESIKEFKLPRIEYVDVASAGGIPLSGMIRYPANFDSSKQYPVLFTPYGGPGAQEVTKRLQPFDFNSYISSDPELEYVTFTLDNRGTGFRGREFRASVARHLGQFEAEDQIFAAQELARQHSFVDAEHMCIWGWSYGGYLTAKVVEADSGVFSCGVSTAPVSDWRLYDSMYTERYMGLPTTNAGNYSSTAVRKVDGFKNIKGKVLIQHGTGDDNVHFQNAAALVDTLVGGGVSPEKLEVQFFTDSDHSINYNGAGTFVYKQIAKQLFEEKNRDVGPALQHQWSKRDEDKRMERFMQRLDVGK